MKDFILDQLKKSFELLSVKTFNETYDAGLTDVRGPKPMKLKFFSDRVEVSYIDNLVFRKSFVLRPQDILEVDLGTQRTNTSGKVITDALIGNIIAGPLGAIGMAGKASQRGHEDVLNIVINYKGESRPLILQTSRNTQKFINYLNRSKVLKKYYIFCSCISALTAQVKYDTIIDQGIYKSYFNTKIKEPVAVIYKLFCAGGSASRNNDHFLGNSITLSDRDYLHSGYDRGHLVPAEDFAYSDSLQGLTFRYYNCVPQYPRLNRGRWKKYEGKARKLSQSDTIIIICYNDYNGEKAGNLSIPVICYKAVYDLDGKLLFAVGFQNRLGCKEVEISEGVYLLMSDLRDNFLLNNKKNDETEATQKSAN